MAEVLYLVPVFFTIAFCYAVAGFGGGSSYLAVLALAALPTSDMRIMALVCNIIVSGGGVYHFVRADLMPWRKALPLVLCSIPAAYLGGRIALPREQFMGVLAIILLVVGGLMWWQKATPEETLTPTPAKLLPQAVLGSTLGFLAGLVSIGGGIFLSPVLFLRGWGSARAIAALTSLFIFVNSLAGIGGQLSTGVVWPGKPLLWLGIAVLVGGQLGSRLTINRLSPTVIRRVAAVLILLVGTRLLVQVTGTL